MSMNAAVGHLARRGLHHAQQHFSRPVNVEITEVHAGGEQHDGPKVDIKPQEVLPVVITGAIALLLIASIRYTLGEVMASLAMIEPPSSTAIIEPKQATAPPPYSEEAYADEPDAPLEKQEKEGFLPSEAMAKGDMDTDVEVTVINHKPITAGIRATISHLHRTGGFFARWRGLGVSILYHTLHGLFTNLLASFLGFGLFGNALCYIFVSLGLMRVHMLWTHSMIAAPSAKPWFRRFVPRKECRRLLLPTLVHAIAQQATFILPMAVAFAVGLPNMATSHGGPPTASHHGGDNHPHKCGMMALSFLRLLAIPTTALFVAFAILLPAAVTLTRIEATLLTEGEDTIVPFDREAIVGDIDCAQKGGCRALFVQAWRSFDRSARLRLVKLYVKMVLAQLAIAFVAVHVMAAEVYLIAGERVGAFAEEMMKMARQHGGPPGPPPMMGEIKID